MRELTLDRLPKKVLARLDLETAFKASRCVIAAERLLLFHKLESKELSAADIGKRTGINKRYREPFLDFLVFLGLLKKKNGLYRNSPLAVEKFIKARSVEWSNFWSGECVRDFEAFTVLEEVLTSGESWQKLTGKDRKPDYELVLEDRRWARDFAYALYDLYKPDADILADNLDLSNYRSLLDVGGGSGVISFALVRKNPGLKACVLELPYVCDAAREIIKKERLSRRVTALDGDMNRGLPDGFDVIMFWNIGWIDPKVMKTAYAKLPEGGMVVRDCAPSSRSRKKSPFAFMFDYLSVRPKQQSQADIINSLKAAGFGSVKYRRISRNLGVITGLKDRAG